MMRTFKRILLGLGVLVVLAGAGFAYWVLFVRYEPRVVTKNTAEIAQTLENSGWVSPHIAGDKKIYMISFRSCPWCIVYEKSEFPALQKAGVDTRVIMVARRDDNGASKSTAVERSTVAELWVNRSWPLFEEWSAVQPTEWTAPGIPSADTDIARGAVVEQARKTIDDLTKLMPFEHGRMGYPTLVWWDAQGRMRAYVGWDAPAAKKIRQELGVPGNPDRSLEPKD